MPYDHYKRDSLQAVGIRDKGVCLIVLYKGDLCVCPCVLAQHVPAAGGALPVMPQQYMG